MSASGVVRLKKSPEIGSLLPSMVYCDKSLTEDGFVVSLTEDIGHRFRVYVLLCRGPRGERCRYVGIVHTSELRHRMRKHWGLVTGGAHYTKMYPPQKILYLMTAPTEAAEAYVYFELLRAMDANKTWMLGGWVQTSSNPSRLDCLLAEQARRGMKELCFNCGQRRFEGEHKRLRKCPFTLRGVEYECPRQGCQGKLVVTSRGHAERLAEPPAAAPTTSPAGAQGASPKRPAPEATRAEPVRKVARTVKPSLKSGSSGARVRICGVECSALSWFLNNADPGRRQNNDARNRCAEGAVELSGGHSRVLATAGFAKAPPGRPKPLCLNDQGEERTRWGERPLETEVPGVTVQRVRGGRPSKRNSQVLYPVDALQKVFRDTA
jgi:hypothetical protein